MTRRTGACLVVAYAALHGEQTAIAQSATPTTTPAAQSEGQRAEKLAADAYEQQAAGAFAEAIGSYLAAYKISSAAVILFNVATIYDRRLHEDALAIEYYRRYLGAADAEPELARKATSRLEELKTAKAPASPPEPLPTPAGPVATAAPVPAAAPPAPPPPPVGRESGRRQTAGIVVGGVGLVTLGATAVLSIVARVENGDANGYCNGSACSNPLGVSDARAAGNAANAATVTFIGGAVLVAVGVGIYLLSPSKQAAPKSGGAHNVPNLLGDSRRSPILGVAF